MKRQIGYGIVIILTLIGGFHALFWLIDISEKIEANFSERAKYDILQEKYNDYAKRAYSLGRFWGEETARGLEDEAIESDNIPYFASETLTNRTVDFLCFGPDDCGDLPTDEQLKEWFDVKWGSNNMPVNAFRSGYIDAFVEYVE